MFFLSAVSQAVNCENLQNGELELAVKNYNPPFDGSFRSGASGARGSRDAGPGSRVKIKIYPIKISVKNQLEGPRFDPKVKAIPISEGGTFYNNAEVISSYPAIDEDTGKVAENVRSVLR